MPARKRNVKPASEQDETPASEQDGKPIIKRDAVKNLCNHNNLCHPSSKEGSDYAK